MGILKVSAQSNAIRAAGALANTIRQDGRAEIQAIGPKAVNQTVKAIAIARSYLASSGVDLVAIPSFVDVEIDGEPRTALRFLVQPRHLFGGEAGVVEAAVAPEVAEPVPEPRTTSFSEALAGKGSVTPEDSAGGEPAGDDAEQPASDSEDLLPTQPEGEAQESDLNREELSG
jgi:stage V sporulation protein S